jgi:hypothetical protein
MREVKFDNLALSYLYDLAKLLFDKEYFSFVETADKYIDDIIVFILKNIHTFPHKKAPAYFSKYGKNLFYISYHRNQRTTWYILFEKTNAHFLIRYITNNHKEGQFFE